MLKRLHKKQKTPHFRGESTTFLAIGGFFKSLQLSIYINKRRHCETRLFPDKFRLEPFHK